LESQLIPIRQKFVDIVKSSLLVYELAIVPNADLILLSDEPEILEKGSAANSAEPFFFQHKASSQKALSERALKRIGVADH
jgi:hypothetical protein